MRRLVLLAALGAVVAASCSSGDTEVASVGDVSITQADLAAIRTTYEDADAISGSELRDDLSRLIVQEAVIQRLEDEYGQTVSAAELETAFEELQDQLDTAGVTVEDQLGLGATEELLRRDAEARVLVDMINDVLLNDPDRIEALFTDDPTSITEVCARHILVETSDDAQGVIEALDAGEDFATLATEQSIDTGTPGGDLGCSPASRYVPEFADATVVAPIGEIFGPVQTDFGFHVIIVDGRTAPTLEEVQENPADYVDEATINAEIGTFLGGALSSVEIVIASNVGTWDPDTLGITPPG